MFAIYSDIADGGRYCVLIIDVAITLVRVPYLLMRVDLNDQSSHLVVQ